MIDLQAPFLYRSQCKSNPLSLFWACHPRSSGTGDSRPPLPRTVPPKATRPYLRRQVPRPCGSGPYVWSNIPLSCVVTDSSALSIPAANRSARILDIRFSTWRASVKTYPPFCGNCLGIGPWSAGSCTHGDAALNRLFSRSPGK